MVIEMGLHLVKSPVGKDQVIIVGILAAKWAGAQFGQRAHYGELLPKTVDGLPDRVFCRKERLNDVESDHTDVRAMFILRVVEVAPLTDGRVHHDFTYRESSHYLRPAHR